MKVSYAALLLGASMLMAACGGGGGSAAPTLVSVPLTTANYDPTGRAAAATLIDASSSSSSAGGLASVSAAPEDAIPASGFLRFAKFAGRRATAAFLAREQPAASQTDSASCTVSGNLSVTVNDNNNNNQADAGDSASITFNACKVSAEEPAVNGTMEFAFQSITLDSGNNLTGFSATVTARQLTSGGSSLDGPADYVVTPTRMTINFRNAVSTRNGVATVYNFLATFDASGVDDLLTVAGEIGIKGASYTLSTPTALVMGNFYPRSGVLRVADAAGGRVDIVMGLTSFNLDLYLAGDAVRDATVTYTWAALAAGQI